MMEEQVSLILEIQGIMNSLSAIQSQLLHRWAAKGKMYLSVFYGDAAVIFFVSASYVSVWACC